MFNKKLISTICAISLLTTLNAKEFTLDELIDIALKNNSNIEISKNQKTVKEEEVKKAKASYLPKVSLNADVGNYDIESGASKQDGNANGVTLSANQLIYDFGRSSSQIEASKANLESSTNEITSNSQNTILSIKKAYYDILNRYQQIIVSKESVELNKLQLSQAKEYFKAGVRTQIDVTNAQLQLSNSELQLLQANYNLKTAKTNLISILGTDLNENIEIVKEKKDIKTLSKNSKLSDSKLENYIQSALEDRPEINKLKAQINAARQTLKGVDAQYYPTLDLNASYSDKNSSDIPSLESEQTTVLLNFKWDIFTGNTTKADKRISLANLSTAQKQLQQQKLQIKQDVTNAYLKVEESFDSIKIGLLSLDLATKNLDLANQRYVAGLNDLLEVNSAKLDYTQAKSNLVNTYYQFLNNQAQLDYAVGIIK